MKDEGKEAGIDRVPDTHEGRERQKEMPWAITALRVGLMSGVRIATLGRNCLATGPLLLGFEHEMSPTGSYGECLVPSWEHYLRRW